MSACFPYDPLHPNGRALIVDYELTQEEIERVMRQFSEQSIKMFEASRPVQTLGIQGARAQHAGGPGR